MEPDATTDKPRKKFKLARRRVPLDVELLDGTEVAWSLLQMTGHERDVYEQATQKRFAFGKDGTVERVVQGVDLFADLIFRCLRDEADKAVGLSVIQGFPPEVQDEWFDLCQELNGLGKFSKASIEAAKKNSPADPTSPPG